MKIHVYIPLVVSLLANLISTTAIPIDSSSRSPSHSPKPSHDSSSRPPPHSPAHWMSQSTGEGGVRALFRKHADYYKSAPSAVEPDVAAFLENPPAYDGFKHESDRPLNMDWVDQMAKFSVAGTILANEYSRHQPVVDCDESLKDVGLGEEKIMKTI
ncbi:hypothetical protein H0H93_006106, partial [Arthromyces matolae]